jgi:hypothetical protein
VVHRNIVDIADLQLTPVPRASPKRYAEHPMLVEVSTVEFHSVRDAIAFVVRQFRVKADAPNNNVQCLDFFPLFYLLLYLLY